MTAALASLALGYWLSGMLVRQVTELAAASATLKPGQEHETLARPGQDPEVAMLARAFEDYQARIEQMIRREQEFTSNASHELRTPLTAIGPAASCCWPTRRSPRRRAPASDDQRRGRAA